MGRPPEPITALWLSHHFPEDYDRCVVIGGRHVCRRCLALYPLAFVVMVVVLSATDPATPWAAWATVLLPVPAVVEFVAEHLGAIRHAPRRQVAMSMVLGVGLGVGFARYLDNQTDPVFWAAAIGYGTVCFVAAWIRQRRRQQVLR